MDVADRVDAFQRWSDGRGLVTRDVDRVRVARDLFEIAGPGPVEEDHVEELAKRYRQGLMGARTVLAAKRVGEELLAWQEEVAHEDALAARPSPEPPPPPRPAHPTPDPDGGENHSPLDGPREGDLFSQELEQRARRLFESSAPPPRDRAPSSRPPPVSSSRPPRIEKSQWLAVDDVSLRGPRSSRAPAPSSRPPASARSFAPDLDDSFDIDGDVGAIDDRPKSVRPGIDRPPSYRPETGLDLSERPTEADHRPPPSARPPPGAAAPPPIAISPLPPIEYAQPFELPKRVIAAVLASIALVAVIAIFALRPGCIFAKSAAPVSGRFESKHLGLVWEFPAPVNHAETHDDKAKLESGWTRRVSVFFTGASPSSFDSQIVLVTFQRDDKRATDEDARQLGANETVGTVTRRQCGDRTFTRGSPAVVCSGFSTQPAQAFAIVEVYYQLDGRALFLRYSREVPLMLAAAEAQGAQADPEILRILGEVRADAMKLVDSIETARR